MNIHPSKQYLPSAMQTDVGYAQTIAERAISIATLDEQYSEELSGIFDDVDK